MLIQSRRVPIVRQSRCSTRACCSKLPSPTPFSPYLLYTQIASAPQYPLYCVTSFFPSARSFFSQTCYMYPPSSPYVTSAYQKNLQVEIENKKRSAGSTPGHTG